jgi:uncharacterized phage protein (TIGR01671 family)
MREIKFRAWDELQKLYVAIEKIDFVNDRVWINPAIESHNKICDLLLEQYTGLKDKNGVEIYEGDIIKADIREYSIMTMGVIVYSNDLTSYCNLNDGGFTMLMRLRDIEIIGNIHENPELITVG